MTETPSSINAVQVKIFLILPGEKLGVKALYKLCAVVVKAKLGDQKMQNKRNCVADKQNKHGFSEAVVRGKIWNGQYARTDAVPDDYACSLHESKLGFTLYLCHVTDLRQS